ncbi:hypothetical protein BC832DRAFT_560010 [Gaertneriomyces semiglobifer]|nr:hypothetical protein BC832DRAFT_560010 [Gaertneriomyces semiglobifer]
MVTPAVIRHRRFLLQTSRQRQNLHTSSIGHWTWTWRAQSTSNDPRTGLPALLATAANRKNGRSITMSASSSTTPSVPVPDAATNQSHKQKHKQKSKQSQKQKSRVYTYFPLSICLVCAGSFHQGIRDDTTDEPMEEGAANVESCEERSLELTPVMRTWMRPTSKVAFCNGRHGMQVSVSNGRQATPACGHGKYDDADGHVQILEQLKTAYHYDTPPVSRNMERTDSETDDDDELTANDVEADDFATEHLYYKPSPSFDIDPQPELEDVLIAPLCSLFQSIHVSAVSLSSALVVLISEYLLPPSSTSLPDFRLPLSFSLTLQPFRNELQFLWEYVSLCLASNTVIPLPLLFPSEMEYDSDDGVMAVERFWVAVGRYLAPYVVRVMLGMNALGVGRLVWNEETKLHEEMKVEMLGRISEAERNRIWRIGDSQIDLDDAEFDEDGVDAW